MTQSTRPSRHKVFPVSVLLFALLTACGGGDDSPAPPVSVPFTNGAATTANPRVFALPSGMDAT